MHSDQVPERILHLSTKFVLGNLTDMEREELDQWINESVSRRKIFENLVDISRIGEDFRKRSLINSDKAQKEMQLRLGLIRRNSWKTTFGAISSIAAAVILLIIFLPYGKESSEERATPVSEVLKPQILSLDSMAPGESMAYILQGEEKRQFTTLSHNSAISMCDLKRKKNEAEPVVLEVPRGGEFIVILDDSTKVWLNSASTLIYPEDFTASSRRVKITGEAYFSVTKDIEKNPFFVECDGQTIKVYGTEFNVRSYPEDKSVLTSLAKGSVSITQTGNSVGELMLTPGTQAVFDKESKTAATKPVNIETVTGWRHGRFVFEDQTLWQIMNDLGRWYNFDFEFEDPSLKDVVFMGSIPRYGDFSTAMLILEKSGDVVFRLSDNKIIVDRKH